MPSRERLPTAAGTFMIHHKVSDILKVQRWEAVRGHSSDLILKKESQKKTKMGPLCFLQVFQPEISFHSSASKSAAQHVLQAAVAPFSPCHSRIMCHHTTLSPGSPCHHQLALATRSAVKKKTVVFFIMIHPGVLVQVAPFGVWNAGNENLSPQL